MNRSAVIILVVIAFILVAAESPAMGRLLVYGLIIAGAAYGATLLAAQVKYRKPPVPKAPPPPTDEMKKWQRKRDEIASLPIEEARRRVAELMTNGSIWKPVEADSPGTLAAVQMPATVSELFEDHPALQAEHGDARLGGEEIGRFVWPGPDVLGFGESGGQRGVTYLKIGVDFDGNPIVVKPSQDTVFIVHRPESNPAKWWSADYPSIYHWLLFQELV